MARENELATPLINRFQISNSDLYEILRFLNNGINSLNDAQFPIERLEQTPIADIPLSGTPINFRYESPESYPNRRFVRFLWDSSNGSIAYELRRGISWDEGDVQIRTNTLQAELDPILSGQYTYWLKSINIAGEYSLNAAELLVEIPEISGFIVSSQAIDNNVLLSWSVPTGPYEISHYVIYKNTTKIGEIKGTFTTIFETTGGTFVYGVQAVDIAGNLSVLVTIEETVTQPPDFELQEDFLSILNGTRTNAYLLYGTPEPVPILAVCVDEETYEQHFTDNSWTSPQDQVNAGYPQFIQPTELSGSYQEPDIDYGAVVHNTIVTVTYAASLFPYFVNLFKTGYAALNSVIPQVQIYYSDEDVAVPTVWQGPLTGPNHYLSAVRHLRVFVNFTSSSDLDLLYIANLRITLSVKRENDGGEVSCLASDATGTYVPFNKSYLDIDKVTATAKVITDYSVTVDFVDAPNPTGFYIYVFDSSGNRVDSLVEWGARGIV